MTSILDNIHSNPIVFSQDSKHFFVTSGRLVSVRECGKSDEPLGILRGHTDVVTSLCANPNNRYQVVTSSLDGTIRLWDFTEMSCVGTWTLSPVDPNAKSIFRCMQVWNGQIQKAIQRLQQELGFFRPE
eukprot:CAMPEP_0167764972 /NCGR_PEP_ID=MMETSP0110_2-20121227/14390_1 /TAXON_ID=629695 /ORGANISM="Gymnochlora sp., Strain CCMP2014" /LENGTH=128 /DNA_ID=CAMNT_0007652557 /DNA_START=33 /DNA_END=419 /DNA_ORIENTATION=-